LKIYSLVPKLQSESAKIGRDNRAIHRLFIINGSGRSAVGRVPAATLEKLATLQAPARWSEKITGPGRQSHPEIFRFNTALDKIRPDFGLPFSSIELLCRQITKP